MAGNSQRRGAVRKRGKGIGQGNTAGSGGRVRHSLEGKGPTPKAEDRPYHKAFRKSGSRGAQGERSSSRTRRTGSGPEWVAGRNPVFEALRAGLPAIQVYVAEGVERDKRLKEILRAATEQGVPLLQATRFELDKLTGGAVHQGVALQLPAYDYADPQDILEEALDDQSDEAALVVALDSITDPRNLGAIIRSAAAFGAAGVIIPERRSASMTAAAWKTSAGAAARVPVARATNLNRCLELYAKAGFTIIGLAGESETKLASVDVSGPIVLVVGSEDAGLARLVREHCDVLASIPISSDVESLNASVAAGIALYEICRARD